MFRTESYHYFQILKLIFVPAAIKGPVVQIGRQKRVDKIFPLLLDIGAHEHEFPLKHPGHHDPGNTDNAFVNSLCHCFGLCVIFAISLPSFQLCIYVP